MKQQPIIAHKLDENITPTETKSRGEQKPLQSPKLGATTTWRGRREASLSQQKQPQRKPLSKLEKNRELLSSREATDTRVD